MEILRDESSISKRKFENTAVTIGVFDGVHRGHVQVLSRLLDIAASGKHSEAVVLTFDRHPMSVVHPESAPSLLTTLEEKLSVFDEMGVKIAVVEHFTSEVASKVYSSYIADRLVGTLGMRHLVIGYDFHLGRGRTGSREALEAEGRRLGFGVTVVPPVVLEGSVISSTRIRHDIMAKKISRAARFLGRPFFFDAEVVRGEGIGRSLGFPTANLLVGDSSKLLPPRGVYIVEVDTPDGRFGGMMNIGSTPTIRVGSQRRIEVHIFRFSGDLLGKRVRVHCLSFMREEIRFADLEALREQLLQDRGEAMRFLEKKH